MIQPKSNIVHLPVYQPGKPIEEVKRELGLTEIIKLASNENPYGCSPKAKEAIVSQLDQTCLYPDGASVELTRALARHMDVDADRIILGTGSDEVILMIARAFLQRGDETIMASHTFSQYKHNVEVEGATCVEIPLLQGKHDLNAMLEKITDRTKIIWVCNPNNPTGTIVTDEEFRSFMSKVPADVMVVLDEAYCEYIESDDYPNGLELQRQYDNLVLLRTFSKIYGLASLRVGYGIGDPRIIRAVNQVRPPFNTSRHGQAAALAALGDQTFIEECRSRNTAGLRYLERHFQRLGLDYFPAYGNFIMVHVKRPAAPVFEGLLKRGIIVRGGHQLDFPHSIRVTVGTPEQNEKFIKALEEVLEGALEEVPGQ